MLSTIAKAVRLEREANGMAKALEALPEPSEEKSPVTLHRVTGQDGTVRG